MPRVTRSSEVLNLIEGLFFIDDDVIELAARFYSELRSTVATFGDSAVEKLIPHVTTLMSKLNELSKDNSELKQEIDMIRDDLSSAESKCINLNNSVKDKTIECIEREDKYEEEIKSLCTQLNQCKADNAKLKAALDESINVDSDRLLLESEKKLAALQADRKCLLTTIEVLEADLQTLRAEMASLAAREKKSHEAADLLTELTLAALNDSTSEEPPATSAIDTPCQSTRPPPPPAPHTTPTTPTRTIPDEFGKVLFIGDSHLRYTTSKFINKGAYVECCPGGRIQDIKDRMLSYLGVDLELIYFNVGTNNLRRGYRGGPGYNGGHGKREVLHAMADLLYTAKTQFQNSKILLNSILIRRDIGNRALHDFNSQLEIMCNNFGVTFVEANCCVGRRDLARDGVHFNRRGVSRLGLLFVDVVSLVLRSLEAVPVSFPYDRAEVTSAAPATTSGRSTGTEDAADCSFDHGGSGRRASTGTSQLSGN